MKNSKHLKTFEQFNIEGRKIIFTEEELEKLNDVSSKLGYNYTSYGNGYFNGFYRIDKNNKMIVLTSQNDKNKSYFHVFDLSNESRPEIYKKEVISIDEFISLLNEYDNLPYNSHSFLTEDDYITIDNLDDNLKGEWAVFRIAGGKKFYISSLYKKDLKWNETKLKYSDLSTLKFTKEFATKVASINKERFVTHIGIVNDKGMQIII